MIAPQIPAFVTIFGATGDLTKRKLIPALFNLFLDGHLPQKFKILGVARRGEREIFCEDMLEAVASYSRRGKPDDSKWSEFTQRIEFHVNDYGSDDMYKEIAREIKEFEADAGGRAARIYYCSIPPQVFGTVADGLGKAGLSADREMDRIVIEKPFGRDLQSAEDL
ncbi:glucose-6-phosphate dehydrogenase, partial [bacterium]